MSRHLRTNCLAYNRISVQCLCSLVLLISLWCHMLHTITWLCDTYTIVCTHTSLAVHYYVMHRAYICFIFCSGFIGQGLVDLESAYSTCPSHETFLLTSGGLLSDQLLFCLSLGPLLVGICGAVILLLFCLLVCISLCCTRTLHGTNLEQVSKHSCVWLHVPYEIYLP